MWRKTNRLSAMFLIILLLGAGLRAWGLHEQSLSSDELLELGIAKSPVGEIIRKADGFPPLYHLLLHGWLKLFANDLAARWLSLLFGCMAILAMWKLAPWLDKTKSRVWAALLLALSPFHIWYSQEARAYPLYFLLALLALGFLVRAMRTDRWRDWAAYGLAGVAGVFTHYYFSILLAIGGVFLFCEKRKWRALKRAALAHGGLALCMLPAIWLLIGDVAFQTSTILSRTPFTLAAFGYTFFSFVAGYSVGPSMRELHAISANQAVLLALPWLATLTGGLLMLIFNARRELRQWVWLRRTAIFVLLPVLLCGVLAELLVVNFKPQYVLWAAIPIFVGLGRAIALGLDRWPTQIAVMLLCFVFAASLYNRRFVAAYQNDDVKTAAHFLKTQADREAPVFVIACYMEAPLRYYLGEGWRVRPLPDVGYQAQYLDEVLQALTSDGEARAPFWLVYTRAYHGDPTGQFKKALLEKSLVQSKTKLAGIELYQGN
jgi:uncharacterized membrane protein